MSIRTRTYRRIMPARQPATSGVLSSAQRSALADARDALQRSDPELAAALTGFGGPSVRWKRLVLAALLASVAGVVGVVLAIGPAAIGAVALVLGVGAPLMAGLALAGQAPGVDGPVEHAPG